MDWSEEEKRTLGTAFIKTMRGNGNEHATQVIDGGWYEGFCAIASKAVELVAARCGTMTAEDLQNYTSLAALAGPWMPGSVRRLLEHIAAQGARVAVLEAEKAQLHDMYGAAAAQRDEFRRSMELAQEGEAERDAAMHAAQDEVEKLRERLKGEEDGNRDLVRRAQQAEAQAERNAKNAAMWVGRVQAAADELSDVGAGECGRLDIVTRVRMLKARCAALSAAGQVLSAHVDTPSPYLAEWPHDFTNESYGLDACEQKDANGTTCSHPRRSHRYPCSDTCTHDDAATPGHPERVTDLSDSVTRDALMGDGFEKGAEAMRAACWVEVQSFLAVRGYNANDQEWWNGLKAAIEGAAP